jgi:uncharacterized protein
LALKISHQDLQALPKLSLQLPFKEEIPGLEAVKPVVGDLTVFVSATGMRLVGQVQTLMKLTCDRCLRPYFQNLLVELDERFVLSNFEEGQAPPQRELNRDDFVEVLSPDGTLDITDVVYQAVTLSMPSSCLCSPECPGPPLAPPVDDTGSLAARKAVVEPANVIDPRWKNLKSLFPKDET